MSNFGKLLDLVEWLPKKSRSSDRSTLCVDLKKSLRSKDDSAEPLKITESEVSDHSPEYTSKLFDPDFETYLKNVLKDFRFH